MRPSAPSRGPGLDDLGLGAGSLGARSWQPRGRFLTKASQKLLGEPVHFPSRGPGLDDLGLGAGSLGARGWQPRGRFLTKHSRMNATPQFRAKIWQNSSTPHEMLQCLEWEGRIKIVDFLQDHSNINTNPRVSCRNGQSHGSPAQSMQHGSKSAISCNKNKRTLLSSLVHLAEIDKIMDFLQNHSRINTNREFLSKT